MTRLLVLLGLVGVLAGCGPSFVVGDCIQLRGRTERWDPLMRIEEIGHSHYGIAYRGDKEFGDRLYSEGFLEARIWREKVPCP